MTTTPRLVIAGGGTGGHLFPGVAVAEALLEEHPEAQVRFIGTERGIEATAVPKAGFEVSFIDVAGLKGTSGLHRLKTVVKLPASLGQARTLLKDFGATAVIGVGGYASGPVVLAAKLMGLPTAICEQNSVAGVTNRILGKLVRRVYTTFPASTPSFPSEKVALVGNPVRKRFRDAARSADTIAPIPGRVFIFGGSQGARPLNETLPQAMAALLPVAKEAGLALSVLHQAGKSDVDSVRAAYAAAGVDAEVTPFIDDMVSAYRAADVVVCRAGATSCAEVTALGVPAILIPFPQAADDHQTKNAQDLVDQQAAILLPQRELTAERLAAEVAGLFRDRARREALAAAAKRAGRLDAAEVIARGAVDGFPPLAPSASREP